MELNYVEMITGYPIDWHPIVRADKKRGRGSSKHRLIEGPAGALLSAANSVPGTQLDVSFGGVRCAPGPGDIGTSNSAGTRTDLQRPPLALHGTAGASALTEPPGYSETIGTALRIRGGGGAPASTASRERQSWRPGRQRAANQEVGPGVQSLARPAADRFMLRLRDDAAAKATTSPASTSPTLGLREAGAPPQPGRAAARRKRSHRHRRGTRRKRRARKRRGHRHQRQARLSRELTAHTVKERSQAAAGVGRGGCGSTAQAVRIINRGRQRRNQAWRGRAAAAALPAPSPIDPSPDISASSEMLRLRGSGPKLSQPRPDQPRSRRSLVQHVWANGGCDYEAQPTTQRADAFNGFAFERDCWEWDSHAYNEDTRKRDLCGPRCSAQNCSTGRVVSVCAYFDPARHMPPRCAACACSEAPSWVFP